jgi:phage baseplate assembly protein W
MPTPTSFKDAQALNDIERNVRQYKDLDLFFTRKKLSAKNSDGDVTVSGAKSDINKVTDITAVKRSIRNLVLTNHYEKPFHPEIGCGVRELLFELMTPITAHLLTRKVEDVITEYEPRAQLVGVKATPDLDRNAYELTIEFYVLNAPTELVDLTVLLERLR